MINKGIILWVSVLFCVSASAQLQDSPWPMFCHDLRHTGRSPWLGPETPSLRWVYRTGAAIRSSAAVGADGTIYVGAYSCTLYAFTPDGTVKWRFGTEGGIYSSPAIGSDGTVYVGSTSGHDSKLYAVDSTGNLRWSCPTGGNITSSPAIGPDGTIYVGSQDDSLHAVNPDGTQKWSFPTRSYVTSSPAIGPDTTIYVGSEDFSLYAINPDGSLKWSYPFQGPIISSPAVAPDGTIYVNPDRDDIGLYAINPDGTLKWHCDTLWFQGNITTSSPAIDRDGVIYVGADSPRGLFAINPDGTLRWMYPILDCRTSSPAVDANKTVYVGCITAHTYALDSTGTLKWDFLTDPPGNINTSPAIDDRRTIYFGTAQGESSAFFAVGFFRDVGPVSIVTPVDSVHVDSTYTPESVIQNMGDTLESFGVNCRIDTAGQSVYDDTVPVVVLSPGDTTLVTFGNWTVGPDPGVTYTVTVVTLLGVGLDDRPWNDTLTKVTISVPPPGVEEVLPVLAPPEVYSLSQSYPNPFGSETTIRYGLAGPGQVSLDIYDVTGKLVKTLVRARQKPGFYTIVWDGRDDRGGFVPSGIYFSRLTVYPERSRGAADPALPFPRYSGVRIEGSGAEVPAPTRAEVFTATRKLVVLR